MLNSLKIKNKLIDSMNYKRLQNVKITKQVVAV